MREVMGIKEIVLPETTPALEWVRGRVLQKVSPQHEHALAQAGFSSALLAWARERHSGRVGSEWEFRIAPTQRIRRPLVPDVAYLSYERLPLEDRENSKIPRIAPDAVVEISSPGDRRRDIEDKIGVYLACGTSVVFLVDTKRKTVTTYDQSGSRIFLESDSIGHPSLPGFSVPARMLFEDP